jgi:hypothetical protein
VAVEVPSALTEAELPAAPVEVDPTATVAGPVGPVAPTRATNFQYVFVMSVAGSVLVFP